MNGKKPPLKRHQDPYKGARKQPQSAPKQTKPKPTKTEAFGDEDERPEQIEGRNAVIEALRAGVSLDKVYIAKEADDKSPLGYIAATARSAGAVVVDADKRKLDAMSRTKAHQGVIAVAAAAAYAEVADILERANSRGETPIIVVCDEITDPHNLGAIIRSAEAAGAHGVIIPKRRGAGLTATVAKSSAGAAFHLPVARVANLTQTLTALKKSGIWICGAAQDGEKPLWDADFTVPIAFVAGSEGSGLSRLVRETCDFTVSIPMNGKVASLNASAAAAILLFEAVRQRRG